MQSRPGPTDVSAAVLTPDARMRDRTVVAAGLSFTIAEARLPDAPLVDVNPAFERTTGYSSSEVLGTNCRFPQGPDTDRDTVDLLVVKVL